MKLGSKFWTVIVDAVVSLASVLGTFYLAPEYAVLMTTVVGILQVPVIALIAAIYGENAARIKMGLMK
jgi:hypothetical protein